MNAPALLHTDRTECTHTGRPQAEPEDPGGPLCPAGVPIGWLRYNSELIPIGTAWTSIGSASRALFGMISSSTVSAYARMCARLAPDPAIQALAAAAEVIEAARAAEAAGQPLPWPAVTQPEPEPAPGEVWIMLVQDRHGGPDVIPYADGDTALTEARNRAGHDGVTPEEMTDRMRADGWALSLPISEEGDWIRVIRRTIRTP